MKLLEWQSMFRNSNWNNGASAGVSTTLSWNVEKVQNMKNMFRDNSAFNANISAWKPTSCFKPMKKHLWVQQLLITDSLLDLQVQQQFPTP